MNQLKIIFIGWNDNGEKCLKKILKLKVKIQHIIIPEGYVTENMQKICIKNKIPFTSVNKDPKTIKKILHANIPDLLVVASFPFLLPKDIINYPKLGTINVHGSLLPKLRGYHPLNWALIRDEKETGSSVHYLDENMDSGEILAQKSTSITNQDDVNSLRDRITTIGANLLFGVVKKMINSPKKLPGKKQDEQLATFAPKRYPTDGKITWTQNSRVIFNLIRALKDPYPNAYSHLKNGDQIFATDVYVPKKTGKIIGKYMDFYLVTTGDGVILLKLSQDVKIGDFLIS